VRFAILLILFTMLLGAAPVGYVTIATDSVPDRVFLDGRLLTVTGDSAVFAASPGKHFVSIFPPRKVFQAFKDDAPEHFWMRLRKQGLVGEANQSRLLSSYERGAVRVGTKWVYVVIDDTLPVRLSRAKVQETYRHDSSCLFGTFVAWTLLVAAGMVVSVFLVKLE
jgi:hypothetical protein